MHAQLVATRRPSPPADDTHPYRTGAWRPMANEWNAEPELVHGEIPADLDGTYLRNTENPLHPAISAYHPFDGDGMVHLIEFRDGRAAYRNRFIRTDGLEAEADSDVQLWSLLTLETDVPKSKLYSILHYGGLPMTSKEIVEAVAAELGDERRAQVAAAT